ncbi:hypothetical protein [Chitinimonas sp.]|uniref:hypothetical protein n=1 Tax=Chitinimonas sp. TaxID=1934313 RepID=UPI002F92C13B
MPFATPHPAQDQRCPLNPREETLALFLEGAGFAEQDRCEVIGWLRENDYMRSVRRQLGRKLQATDERAALHYYSCGVSPERAAGLIATPTFSH